MALGPAAIAWFESLVDSQIRNQKANGDSWKYRNDLIHNSCIETVGDEGEANRWIGFMGSSRNWVSRRAVSIVNASKDKLAAQCFPVGTLRECLLERLVA